MGKGFRAKDRFGGQIKNYMAGNCHPAENKLSKAPLVLEAKQPAPGDKPRNPAAHKWLHTGQAKGRIFKDIDPVPFDRNKDVPYGVCFNCWKHDHQQSNCPRPTLDDHCQNCGRIGVKVSNCPRCRRAYLAYRKKNKTRQTSDGKSTMITEGEKEDKENKENKVEKSQNNQNQISCTGSPVTNNSSYDKQPSYEEFGKEPAECDDLSQIIIDESIASTVITNEFLDNFLNFLNAMKYLPAEKRAEIAQNYVFEHRRRLRQESFEV